MNTNDSLVLGATFFLELVFVCHLVAQLVKELQLDRSVPYPSRLFHFIRRRLTSHLLSFSTKEVDPALSQRLRAEIAQIRCNSLKRAFYASWILLLCVMVTIQLNIFDGVTRLMTGQASCALCVVAVLTLFVQVFPSVLTVRTADVLYSVFMMVVCISVSPTVIPSPWLRSQWSAYIFIVRVVTGVTAQRLVVCAFWQTAYLIVIAISYSLDDNTDTSCASPLFPNRTELIGFVFTIVLVCGVRGAMERIVKRDIQHGITRNELGAVSSLLATMCDAVLQLDEDLRLIDHSPQLAGLLMRNTSSSMQGLDLMRFMATDGDRERLAERLTSFPMDYCIRSTVDTHKFCATLDGGPITSAFHADLKDAFGTKIQAEFFHVIFAGLNGQPNHLLGLREYTDICPLLRSEVMAPTREGTPENSCDSSSLLSPPTALFNAYFEVQASTPEFQQITGCTDNTRFEELLQTSAYSADVMKQLKNELNAFVNGCSSGDSHSLKFDGSIFKNLNQSIVINHIEISLFRDENLGCEFDVCARVNLHVSSAPNTRSRSFDRPVSSRPTRVRTHGRGTGPQLTPAGSFAPARCLSL